MMITWFKPGTMSLWSVHEIKRSTPKNYITLWFQVFSPNFPENWIFFKPGTWQMSLLTRRYLAPRGNRCSQVISCGLSGFLLSSTSTIDSPDELCQLVVSIWNINVNKASLSIACCLIQPAGNPKQLKTMKSESRWWTMFTEGCLFLSVQSF